jgi:glycosyltransferase involved in cell wall biosynthesis
VIYPPVHTERFLKIPRVSDDEGFLMWGRLIPYKRFDLAIEAAKRLGFRLNIVGNGPFREQLVAQAGGAPNIVFHGRLSDADLDSLMSRCRAVLFPCYEDFGIVPVEAMAAGLPVVAYGEGGAAESVTPECGVRMRELTVDELLRAIEDLTARSFDDKILRERAKQFDVEVFRTAYQAEVESALAKR